MWRGTGIWAPVRVRDLTDLITRQVRMFDQFVVWRISGAIVVRNFIRRITLVGYMTVFSLFRPWFLVFTVRRTLRTIKAIRAIRAISLLVTWSWSPGIIVMSLGANTLVALVCPSDLLTGECLHDIVECFAEFTFICFMGVFTPTEVTLSAVL